MANELHPFNTGRAIMTVDQVMAVVSMAEHAVVSEGGANQRLGDAWLALQLAGEKLQQLRLELERADMVTEFAAATRPGAGVPL